MKDTVSLRLPNLCINGCANVGNPPVLLIAGGRKPDLDWLCETASLAATVWVADKGLEVCLEAGIVPECVVGDMDSLSPSLLGWLVENEERVVRFPVEKDYTDLQLALLECAKKYPGRPVVVTGCWGGRFDHGYFNALSLMWAREAGINCQVMADELECMVVLRGEERVEVAWDEGFAPEAVSLVPFGDCSGVGTEGLYWALKDAVVSMGDPCSISNKTTGTLPLKVSLSDGWLGLYLCF